jgi:alkanesulfonate monooxygenase SsuD/methylene tetrahydromethanopterin reductase-like flavin-dependent oxidoreductase (luciferase family)
MEFGVFDHLDRGDTTVETHYRDRLDIIEACERVGMRSYHVAEHHLSELGMAPSPNVFLSAVAQRTRRLRFGPMIYATPMYHPLRLLEEIGMLDQMSGGRLEMGFGRGAVAAEIRFFGVEPKESEASYNELVAFVMKGLADGAVTVPEEGGKLRHLPLAIPSLQRPHPPLWYGVHQPPSAERAARTGMNILSLDTVAETRACTDAYRRVWTELHGKAALPMMGLGRFLVVNKDPKQALEAARRAYRRWYQNFTYLSSRMGFPHFHHRSKEFDGMIEEGRAVAGTPETVAEFIDGQMRDAGTNFFVGQFAFGNLTREEMLESVSLFGREVMPVLAGREAVAA